MCVLTTRDGLEGGGQEKKEKIAKLENLGQGDRHNEKQM